MTLPRRQETVEWRVSMVQGGTQGAARNREQALFVQSTRRTFRRSPPWSKTAEAGSVHGQDPTEAAVGGGVTLLASIFAMTRTTRASKPLLLLCGLKPACGFKLWQHQSAMEW